jgi:hypothetical protein
MTSKGNKVSSLAEIGDSPVLMDRRESFNQSLLNLSPEKRWFFVALILVTLISGIRFSDGSLLLAIANGEGASSSAFRDPLTQYHWDQPLKVGLLKLLPPKIVVVAIVFLGITLLPLALVFKSSARLQLLVITSLFLTPSLKVVLQNIGAGDGLLISLVILAAAFPTKYVLTTSFFIIGIWHPHQSFFIGLSALLAIYIYKGEPKPFQYFSILGSLAASLVVYLAYKSSLSFEFHGRSSFVLAHLNNYFFRNLLFAPVAFAPIILWLALAAPSPLRGNILLSVWLLVLAGVSLIATDVTRVMTIISLPIVLGGASLLKESDMLNSISKRKVLSLMAMVLAIPVYSWSGLDYFLWSDVIADMRKWGVI